MLIQTIVNEFNTYFDQSPDHDTILWFDPQGEWRGLLPYLASQLPLLVFDGSQLQVRHELAQRRSGERVVVYLPLEREQARFLHPYFYTARCYQASIARVLRDAGIGLPAELRQRGGLLPALAVASAGKGRAFWEGIVNLKTALDRLIVDLDDTLLRLLADPRRTMADLSRQQLTETFFELVAAEFGITPPEPGQEDAWGDHFTAHLCLVETYEGAGRPESFPFKGVLPPPVHWDRCRGFLSKWQHHELFKAAFRRRVKAIDGQYPLGPWAVEAPAPVSDAFLNVEKALWAKAQRELEAIQSKADAIAFASERRDTFQDQAEGFWAREGEVPGWRALAHMADVILGAQEALDELDRHSAAAAMVEAYTQRWWKIDRDYRCFRVELDRGAGGLDAAFKWTERIYHDYLDGVNSRFTHMVAGEGTWPPAGQSLGGSALLDRPAGGAKGLRALIMVDALRYELALDLAGRLEIAPSQVGVGLSPVPSVTELGMAAILPGWPDLQVDYADGEWIITPPGSTDNLARKDKRLAWLIGHLGPATVFDLDRWLSTPLDQVDRGLSWIVLTSSTIDTIGEGVGMVALDTFDSLLSRLEQSVRRLLAIGCVEIRIVTDHGFLLRERVRETEKVQIDVEGVLKKAARYLIGRRDLPPIDLPQLPVSGGQDLVAWFPRGIDCFVTRGPYNYMHGGIALQEVVIPHIQVQQSVAERLVGVGLQLVDGHEIRNAIFKVRLTPEGADLLSKARQVEIEVVRGEERVSRVWQERVEREVVELSLMLEPDYGLAVGDQVQVRVRDGTTGELLARQPATVFVDLDL
ncbi:MAG: hypothetical protein Kow0063_40690 [Anaerolineae bacterium]